MACVLALERSKMALEPASSLFHGLTEILHAMVVDKRGYTCGDKYIRIHISSLDEDVQDEPQTYTVKVLGNRGINFKKLVEEQYFKSLTAVVKETEYRQSDCHVCAVNQMQSTERIKYLYTFCETSGCLRLCETEMLPVKPSPFFKISFQVVEEKESISKQCQRIHSFLQRLKMVNSQICISFYLHLFGVDCSHSDICSDVEYLPGSICDKEKLPPFAITPSYYIRDQEICSSVHVKAGAIIPLLPPPVSENEMSLPLLSAQAIAILVPHRQQTVNRNHGFINIMFSCLDFVPVSCVVTPEWRPDRIGEIFHSCICQVCSNTDPFQSTIQLHVNCIEPIFTKQHQSYAIYIVINIKPDDSVAHPNINELCMLNMCKEHLPAWSVLWGAPLQQAVDSAVNCVWHPEFLVRNRTPVETPLAKAISVITDSVLCIVTSSTEDDFRKACFAALQVGNASELRQSLSDKLYWLAKDRYQTNTCEPESHYPDLPVQPEHCNNPDSEQDSFVDLAVHEQGAEIADASYWTGTSTETMTEQESQEDTERSTSCSKIMEDKESCSQEWYDDSLGELDNWMEE